MFQIRLAILVKYNIELKNILDNCQDVIRWYDVFFCLYLTCVIIWFNFTDYTIKHVKYHHSKYGYVSISGRGPDPSPTSRGTWMFLFSSPRASSDGSVWVGYHASCREIDTTTFLLQLYLVLFKKLCWCYICIISLVIISMYNII